ncbi:MAG TPA: lysophospholipid acyltransferase family protein [Candidatus Binatia bacterium]|nr:lysophospholipid acyltransferase family protein [Candidatus Binatia bacterium]
MICRALYLAWIYTMIGLWTLIVFPSSLLVTVLTGSHRIGHRLHSRLWGHMILASCGVRLRVHGREQLQRDGAYVLMLNHNSHFAGYALAAALPLQWRAVLALKLRKIPIFAWIALLAGHVFIDTRRTPAAIGSLNAAADKLRGGLSVLVFPEGRHHDARELLPFKHGGFHLAVAARVPVVPVTAVERSGAHGRVQAVDLYIDAPIPTADISPDAVPQFAVHTRVIMSAHLR